MKKILLVVITILSVFSKSLSQEGAVSSDMVQIGSLVPDFTINILHNEGVIKKNIKDYRGKVVILEFWATYCGPCIPAMDHLAQIYGKMYKDLEVIAISDEERWKVVNFLKKRPTSLSIGIDTDKSLNRLFYHQFMPHTIIIDPQGYMKAITSPDQITEEIIYLAKSGAVLPVKTKAEFAPKDETANALTPIQSEDKSFYKVIVSPAVEGVQSQINKKSDAEYEFINCTVPLMYQVLYQTTKPNPNERACLEVTENTKFLLQENQQYCLKLKVPEPTKHRIGEIGMRHLEEIFAVKAINETRTRKVYALVINKEGSNPSDSVGTNIPLKDFIKLLWDTRMVEMPIVNESGLDDNTLIKVAEMPKEATKVQESLQKMGFKLEPKTTETACLILHLDKNEAEKKNF
jgi:thiol-disulfide isomerase/thioredoxin